VVLELVLVAPPSTREAPMVALTQPAIWRRPVEPPARIRRVLWTVARDPAFRRQHCSAWEAAQKYHISSASVLK
jgi:hypothetical protein